MAEICWQVWGTPTNFNEFRVLAALLHGTLVVGVSQTLWHWTEGVTYIRQGGHYVGHWPTFPVVIVNVMCLGAMYAAVVSHYQCVNYAGCPKIGIAADTGNLVSSVTELGMHSSSCRCSYCVRLWWLVYRAFGITSCISDDKHSFILIWLWHLFVNTAAFSRIVLLQHCKQSC